MVHPRWQCHSTNVPLTANQHEHPGIHRQRPNKTEGCGGDVVEAVWVSTGASWARSKETSTVAGWCATVPYVWSVACPFVDWKHGTCVAIVHW